MKPDELARRILMTAFTTILSLVPLAFSDASGFVGAELATVAIGGLVSSTFLTLVAVLVTYILLYETIPNLPGHVFRLVARPQIYEPVQEAEGPQSAPTPDADDPPTPQPKPQSTEEMKWSARWGD